MNKKYRVMLFSSTVTAIFLALIFHFFILKQFSLVESFFIWFPFSIVLAFMNQSHRENKRL